MVIFNDLRISPDGNNLIIDVSISNYAYFKNMYISAIYIDTEETYVQTGMPSSKAVVLYENQNVTIKEHSDNITPKRLNLDSFNNHIFYIYVKIDGVPTPDTPCSMDKEYTIGVALNWFPIYQKGLKLMKQVISNCCDVPREFIDYVLRLKAFELAIKTSQFTLVNSKYLEWFKDSTIKYINSCNCK